jgi:6-pyruvoyltetrahydropterin/6-carboxytetrahydropterin synthase
MIGSVLAPQIYVRSELESMDSHVSCTQIDIDFSHKVKRPGASIHGHRGRIEAWIRGDLQDSGEQGGLVLDCGFIKDVLHEHITAPCDHGLILDVRDPAVRLLRPTWSDRDHANTVLAVCSRGHMSTEGILGKLYLIADDPTAPNLARHWYERIKQPALNRSGGQASLVGIRFWETPNCWSAYGPAFGSDAAILEWNQML